MITMKVLGAFRVEVDGRPVDAGGRLARMVLVQLLLARGAVVPTERIIERLWPARVPSSAQASLHAYVARLRRVLEPERAPRTPARLLVSAPYGYALALAQDAVDAWVFESRVADRSLAELPAGAAAEGLAGALASWGGQPYAEFADAPWTAGERARLEELHRTARERLAAARLGCGQAAQALADAGALTREQPLHEEGWRLLALALWARDRQGDALAALRRARHVLGEELGVEPGPALLELEQALLHQRLDVLHRATGSPAAATVHAGAATTPVPGPARAPGRATAAHPVTADVPATAAGPETAADPATAAVAAPAAGTATAADPATAVVPATATEPGAAAAPAAPPAPGRGQPALLTPELLLGRDAELAGLAAAADRARAGRAQVVLVSGEAGIGKSSLLHTAVRQLPEQGWLVGHGQCPETDGAPPGRAWFDMLPDLARTASPGPYADELSPLLAPGTAGDSAQPEGSPARRFRLHRALLGWLRDTAVRQPLAIVLDDLHRGDSESIELFLLCAEELRDVPLLLVGSYRTGEGDLTGALARLAACSPVRLALGGLSDDHAVELLQRGAADMSDHAAVALAERAGGNPFYLRESALLLAGEGEQQALARVPQGVQDVLRRRLALLAPTVTAGLRLAAVAGREAPVALLVHAADSDAEQLLDALDTGVTAGLLTEPRPGTVRFTHALVRDALEGDLTRLRLARMHSRLGRGLIALGSDDVAATAHHLLRAAAVVTADAGPAVRHARLACEQAVRRYAPQNAEALLDAALGLLTDHPAAFADQDVALLRVMLLGQLVDCRIRMGAVVPAREAQEQAVRVARAEGRADLLVAAWTTWTEPTPWRVRPYAASDPEAVEELGELLEDPGLTDRQRCLLLDQLSDALDDTDPRAVAVARQAVDLARTVGEPRLRGLTLTSLLRKVDCELDPAPYLELHRELGEVADAQDSPEYSWMSAYTAARIAAADNDPAEMERCLVRADGIARRYGLQGAFAVARLRRPMLAMARGRFEEAEEAMASAVAELRARGAVDLSGLAALGLGCMRLQQGRLAEMVPVLLVVWERYKPHNEGLAALALLADGRPEEAREIFGQRVPLRRDFAFSILAGLRGMAAVALGDTAAATEVYEDLVPLEGLAGGTSSLSLAFRPVAQTLGELAGFLGRPEAARRHFREAERVAAAWDSPHWAGAARSALAALPPAPA
ncbi:BTAD domain-containing putative transcriptional regulator [Streptomyces sp. NRRL S-87]|uniref:BTAD domain-containing putative transcriptional regulator n=1 Tax=Streptomyces sp. NRRL S-87 TaxID=1463920 RepID=UPI0004C01366|nr:BTAD domain-containing putative transcriptional regulator [Streptomyces sp. NRRL S-87]